MVGAALVIIWIARISSGRDLYLSALGAAGEPAAHWFETALLLIVTGGGLIAYAARGIRSRLPILGVGAPAVSLGAACFFFFLASQVTCTPGCPLPIGPAFDWQDLIHAIAAVLAFAAACLSMLQVPFAVGHRPLALLSRWSGFGVIVIAGIGGLFSLAQFQTGIGGQLELLATTIALVWLFTLGLVLGLRRTP